MTANAMYIGNVPEVFLIADRIADRERMAERSKIKTRKARIIPMPTIEGNKGAEGPLHVGQEYKEEFYKQKAETKKKELLVEAIGLYYHYPNNFRYTEKEYFKNDIELLKKHGVEI